MGCIWRRVKLFPKKRRIRGAILRQAYVFPWSRTTCTLPSENPRLSCLACVLHRFCGLRINVAFHRRAVVTLGHVLLVRSLGLSSRFLNCSHLHRFCGLRIYFAFHLSVAYYLYVPVGKSASFLSCLRLASFLTQYYLLASLSERKAYRLQPQFRIPHLQ